MWRPGARETKHRTSEQSDARSLRDEAAGSTPAALFFRGTGCEAAVVVAQQAGCGRDPQRAGLILQQVIDGVALEWRRILGVEGDKVDAIKADQASVRAQP